MRTMLAAVLAASIVVACGPLKGLAQHDLSFGTMELAQATTVPFEIAGNHIFVRAELGGKPYVFAFDSGGTAALVPSLARRYPALAQAHVVGVGSQAQDVDIVRVSQLRLGAATYRDGSFLALDLPLEAPPAWHDLPFGGMIGREFLRSFAVTIDYAARTLTLTPPPAFRPAPGDVALALTLVRARPTVTASIDGHQGRFQIDTGARSAIVLTGAFAGRAHLPAAGARTTPTVVGQGTGGLQLGTAFRARTLALGSATVPAPVAFVAAGGGGVYADDAIDGNIGGQVLRRFVVVLDEPDGLLYLRPARDLAAPFPYNRGGLFGGMRNGDLAVTFVSPGSPAAEAGVQAGDVLVRIDGRPASGMSPDARSAAFARPAGTAVGVVLLRGGATVRKTLVLRELL